MGDQVCKCWVFTSNKRSNRIFNDPPYFFRDTELEATIKEVVDEYDIDMNNRVEIFIGKDTRPSSPSLSKAVIDGVLALSGKPIDYGIVTTPQLHYFVACKNSNQAYGVPTEEGYYRKLTTAFKKLRGDETSKGNYVPKVMYDGANGVGAKKIKFFQEGLGNSLQIELFNDAVIGTGKLNHLVRIFFKIFLNFFSSPSFFNLFFSVELIT